MSMHVDDPNDKPKTPSTRTREDSSTRWKKPKSFRKKFFGGRKRHKSKDRDSEYQISIEHMDEKKTGKVPNGPDKPLPSSKDLGFNNKPLEAKHVGTTTDFPKSGGRPEEVAEKLIQAYEQKEAAPSKRPESKRGEPKPPLLQDNEIIRERWHIRRKLGGGGFGEIYQAWDTKENTDVAVKTEKSDDPKQVLKMEVAVLRRLQGKRHSCKFYGCGRTSRYNYLVMTLCGKNLSDMRRETPHGYFSTTTTVRLSYQSVISIEDLHGVGFLHRDIKPSNFAIGRGDKEKHLVYMLDFGLARQYVSANGEHRAARAAAGFRGTVRYASLNAHYHKELSRVDDLWSWYYLLIEFARGALPWRKLRERDDVRKLKEKIGPYKLAQGLSPEFMTIAKHLDSLDYYEKPDYTMIATALKKTQDRLQAHDDDPFDWENDYQDCYELLDLPEIKEE